MFDEELRKMFVVFQTFLQLSYKETEKKEERGYLLEYSKTNQLEVAVSPPAPLLLLDLLSVPVVDLVNVPEDDFVFSFHVVWDALLFNPLHKTLKGHKKGG